MNQIEDFEPCCIRHQFLLREPVRCGNYTPTQETHSGEHEQQFNGFSDINEEVREVVKTKRFQRVLTDFDCPECGVGCCDCDCILRCALQLLGLDDPALWEEKLCEK